MDRTGGSKDEKGQENQLKFVLIGDSGVGKTTMINSYISQTPEKFTNPTVGSMFFSKKLFVDGKEYNLQIWDTAGQERFKSMTPSFFRDAHGVLMVFDLTEKSTLIGLRDWSKMVKDHAPEKIAVCIAGNKMDLDDQIVVREEELKEFADWVGCPYVLTSAWQNRGIEDAFRLLVKQNEKNNPSKDAAGKNGAGSPSNGKASGEKLESGAKDPKDKKDKKCCS